MAVTLTNPTLSTTFTASEVEQNFSDIVNRFGSIDNSDIKASAGISLSKLEGRYERLLVSMVIENHLATHINGLNFASLSATTTGIPLVLVPLPGDSSDANYSIIDVSWVCTDTGDGATKVRVEWGYYDAVGTWTVSTTPVAAFALTNANAAQDANDVHQVNGSAAELDFNHATGGNTPRSLALVLDTQGVGTLSNGGDILSVSLMLRRDIQAA